MIKIENLAMQYGARLLFADVNLTLHASNRYSLVGANGAGKTTFFKLLMNEQQPSNGEVVYMRNARIGCLSQDQFKYENTLIINTVIAGNKELWNAMQEKEKLLELDEFDEDSGYRLGELEQIIADNDGYTAEITAAELLVGLGIQEKMHYETLSRLSGGYKLRVLLAQSLFNNPDILLLDEPTNHLDIISIYWLENYLKEKFKGVLLFISHDVMFLNNVSTHTLDIDYGEIKIYTGNYNSFIKQKQETVENKMHEVNYLEKKIATMQAFVDKFKAGTRSRQASSREKQIEKIELPDVQKSSRVSPTFNFNQKRNSGKSVLEVKDIAKKYENKIILNNVNFHISRGEKIVVIGANGIGKSTLLKILLDHVKADKGMHEWGYETHISYFAQDHHELLNDENTNIIEWLTQQAPHETIGTIRNTLGQVLFSGDDINKNILNLSGGEGARLLLAKIMLEKSNVLILDEPTNHLDIESKDSLKKALVDYSGTLILVTHDRDFATAIATRIIALTTKGVVDFKGTYEEYLSRYSDDYLNSSWIIQNQK